MYQFYRTRVKRPEDAGAADFLTNAVDTVPPRWALTNFLGESPNGAASSDAPPY
jgi:hypothetical protein